MNRLMKEGATDSKIRWKEFKRGKYQRKAPEPKLRKALE
jgi:hypothetical protein